MTEANCGSAWLGYIGSLIWPFRAMQTPPPLPEPKPGAKPPPLPSSGAPRTQGQSPVADYLELRRRSFWFVPVILVGIPVGLLRQTWQEVSNGDDDARQLLVFSEVVGGLGIIVILAFMLYLLRHPEKKSVGGLRRSYWLLGLPSAWCLGASIGLLWKYL